jgi:hypothetical protein
MFEAPGFRNAYPSRLGMAVASNVGGDPVETIAVNSAAPYSSSVEAFSLKTYGIAVGRSAGPAPGRLRLTYAGGQVNGGIDSIGKNPIDNTDSQPLETVEYTQEGPTLFGHADLPEVMTVGAARAQMRRDRPLTGSRLTPLADTGTRPTEPFSARGGTEILFDAQGKPLTQPVQRHKPDVAGEDAVDNRAFGLLGIFRGQSYTTSTFFGTSAAAAHVGGLVALAKQAAPSATPAQIAEALRRTAQDLDDTLTPGVDAGFDFATGYGLADGENLIAKLLGQPLAPRDNRVTGASSTCANPTVTLPPGARYRGTKGNDTVQGTKGNEVVKGLRGHDALCGEAGADKLDGGPGNDVIEGGPGNDVLTGGPGADAFRFSGSSSTGVDRIMDLGRGDTIEIVGLKDANSDGKIDVADLTVRNTPAGAVIVALGADPLAGSTERIVVRGRKAARVIRALRILP